MSCGDSHTREELGKGRRLAALGQRLVLAMKKSRKVNRSYSVRK
jgi:hypothetical protein